MSREACRFPARFEKQFPRQTLLGPGGDSTAFLVEDTSVKVFKVFNNLGPLNRENKTRLQAYMQEMRTMKAVLEVRPNPLFQSVEVSGLVYSPRYSVADPGEIISGELDEHLVTVADFVAGENALERANISRNENPNRNWVKTVTLLDENQTEITLSEKETQNLRLDIVRLIMHFNRSFQMSWDNFKIEIDRSNRVIKIVITDAIVKIDQRFKPRGE